MPSPETDDSNQPAPEHDVDAGVVSLIRRMLSLTVGERLEVLQAQADSIASMRTAIEEQEEGDAQAKKDRGVQPIQMIARPERDGAE